MDELDRLAALLDELADLRRRTADFAEDLRDVTESLDAWVGPGREVWDARILELAGRLDLVDERLGLAHGAAGDAMDRELLWRLKETG